jgi:hypothetical protein
VEFVTVKPSQCKVLQRSRVKRVPALLYAYAGAMMTSTSSNSTIIVIALPIEIPM